MEACKNILQQGGIEKILKKENLEEELRNSAKGIGDTTIQIFLRELGLPHKLSGYAVIAAKNHKLWNGKLKGVKGVDRIELEIALLKLGRDYCRKNKCKECPYPCAKS